MEKIETERGQGDVEYRRPERARICRESPLMPRSAQCFGLVVGGALPPTACHVASSPEGPSETICFWLFGGALRGRKTGAGEADFLYLILKG